MLVNYMQLLGLLRLVRINWAEQLTALLTYLDFTSGAATWVSVECSLTDDGAVPRSVMRSIIVLLWPREQEDGEGGCGWDHGWVLTPLWWGSSRGRGFCS